MNRWTFTSESVTEGHPDKMADQISDAVLDALLAQDPMSRVACETLLTTGLVVVAGESTTKGYVEIPKLVREVVTDIGYTSSEMGFDGRTCGVTISIGSQSPDIAQGAGDQGMMFGYACDETDDLMPMPIWLAHRLALRLAQVRKVGVLPYLRPDGKTQVTFEYEGGRPVRLKTVLISTQHSPNIDLETLLLPDLRDHVIAPSFLPSSPRTATRCWRTRPASSSWAAPTPTPGSPAGRSLWTPTAGRPATAAGPSRGKTPPR